MTQRCANAVSAGVSAANNDDVLVLGRDMVAVLQV